MPAMSSAPAPAAAPFLMTNLVTQVAIICAGPLQFGLHMSELNAPLPYMDCKGSNDCIRDMGDGASASSSFAIGGLVGSLVAGSLADKHGRRRVMQGVALLFMIGSLFAATASANAQLVFGRLISGLGAGAAIVVGPMFISELSPPELRGTFGASVQISVNSGILLTQVLGLVWARQHWRRIIWAGVVAALAQFVGLLALPESPKWRGGLSEGSSHDPSLGAPLGSSAPQTSFVGFLTLRRYRRSFLVAAAIMCIQQFSGINAIIFYGVTILKKSIPQNSELINVGLSITNLAVTAASARFIDSVGRRPLLRLSLGGMAVGTTLLAAGLGSNLPLLSAAAALVVIIAFATGLGPIPFLLISELTAPEALGVAQSVATTFNWLATFVIGAFFPLAERLLGAWVWVFFGGVCVFGVWVVSWVE